MFSGGKYLDGPRKVEFIQEMLGVLISDGKYLGLIPIPDLASEHRSPPIMVKAKCPHGLAMVAWQDAPNQQEAPAQSTFKQ